MNGYDFKMSLAPEELEQLQQRQQKLLKNKTILSFMKKYGVDENFIKANTSTFEDYLRALNVCSRCKGLAECTQTFRGKGLTLTVDETGFLDERYVPCKFSKQKSKEQKFVKNFIFKHGPASDYEIDFKNFDLAKESAQYLLPLKKVTDSVSGKKGVFLFGQPGVGKSYMLKALANQYAQAGSSVAFVQVPQLVSDLKEEMKNDEYRAQVMNKLRQVQVLILDDIGSEAISKWTRSEILFPLLDQRMNAGRKTYFTSNYTLDELKEQYITYNETNGTIAAMRIIERIRALAEPVALTGESRR